MNNMAKNRLRALRLEKYPDMTSQAFCEMAGIKPPVYSKYECGKIANPYASNEDSIIRIANALGTTSEAIREMISNNYQLRQQGKLDLGPYSKTRRSSASIEISSSENNVLAHWRISNNLSQSEAANILEVPRATYSMWEQGYTKPIGDNLKKLIDLTGLSMHQIATIPRKVANKTSKEIEEPKQEPLTFSDMPVINAEWPLNFIKQVRRNNTKETYFPIKKEYPFVDQWIADKLFDFVDNPAEKDAQHHYRFNEQQATAVRLYYREFGNNLKSVGEKMGISKSRVQQIIMKAQRKFKICIENEIIRRANEKSDAEVINDNLVKAASAIKENVTKASENFKEAVKDVKVPAIKPEKETTMQLTTKEERTLNNTVYPVDDVKDTNNQIVEIKRVDNATGKMVKMIDRFNDSDMKLLNEVMELCYGKLDFHKYNRLRKILGGLVE